ncbi:flavin prenyltransferase UbiX [Actinocatenispora thailandica]|uniref:Flavin prenyltransferase UbiX n=1 Tax=Actinocatenispora thailandica TaxID=227318 RepID=A0A7R7HYA5_9ACTN|nr:UbiX family flavin prenyltransferase [Actinocatenispora thailandica]BCJ36933.1 flavin prenyltransferase UbiX [Actinocatenispora thailandica]
MTEPRPRRLVVGISGATGIAYGIRVLELARTVGVETHLVVTPAGQQTRAHETDLSARGLAELADVTYRPADIGAAIASGSFPVDGMLVAPCSARTLAAVGYGTGDNLLTRAADVTLKERRRLVLMVRETPLSLTHLRAMTAVTEAGGIVMPPVPAFYLRPATVDELVTHSAARALDLLGIDIGDQPRWGEVSAGHRHQPTPSQPTSTRDGATSDQGPIFGPAPSGAFPS